MADSQTKRKASNSSDIINSASNTKKAKENFSWTDDEIKLLLDSAKDFKAKQEFEGVDWNTVRSRFQDIRDLFVKSYPSEVDDEYPHAAQLDVFTKDRVLLKLKSIRLSFKKALDSGRVSGGGRVVACFYDICSEIWGGSPAVEKMASGVDSSGLLNEDEQDEEQTQQESFNNEDSTSGPGNGEEEKEVSGNGPIDSGTSNEDSSASRRQTLTNKLKEYRNKKLKKAVPFESQMLTLAKDDSELKKNLVKELKECDQQHLEYMKTRDQEQMEYMKNMNSTMNEMTRCISSGFTLLSNIFQQHQQNHSLINPQSYQNLAPMQNAIPFQHMFQQQTYRFGETNQGQPHSFLDETANELEKL